MSCRNWVLFGLICGLNCLPQASAGEHDDFRQPPYIPAIPPLSQPAFSPARTKTQMIHSDSNIDYRPQSFPERKLPVQSESERIAHLRTAARNLSLGGFEKEAAELEARAKRLEQELQQSQVPPSTASLMSELRQLRQSMDSLRSEVQLLRTELHTQRESHAEAGSPNTIAVPQLGDEAHIRLEDRLPAIPDEELDAPQPRRRSPQRNKTHAPAPTIPEQRPGAVEFELVPLPVESEELERDPAPTRAKIPTSAPTMIPNNNSRK